MTTKAEVEAALKAWFANTHLGWPDAMTAALTAAHQVRALGSKEGDVVERADSLARNGEYHALRALISSIVADRDEARQSVGYNADVADFHDAVATQWHTCALTAERRLAEAVESQLDDTAAAQWLRAWVKRKFGVWITWRTAWAAIKDMRDQARSHLNGGSNG